ncbi:DNA-directed RNA polymerase subunit H [Candidatus Woesearchaeota archaeon]|nr:DNA-directed RNA polymerase subunit H [Candidatus Woesearchaeota archaeon]
MTSTKKTSKHELIPVHEKLSDTEKEKLLSALGISFREIPKIRKNDPALAEMDVKAGDIIKISRKSVTAKNTVFYRGVTDV